MYREYLSLWSAVTELTTFAALKIKFKYDGVSLYDNLVCSDGWLRWDTQNLVLPWTIICKWERYMEIH